VSFRRFPNATAGEGDVEREDTLQDFGAGLIFTPRFLADLSFARSGSIRLAYDLLHDDSNAPSSNLDRNFVGVSIEIGLLPITGQQIARYLGK
jgi:hypothetical protein